MYENKWKTQESALKMKERLEKLSDDSSINSEIEELFEPTTITPQLHTLDKEGETEIMELNDLSYNEQTTNTNMLNIGEEEEDDDDVESLFWGDSEFENKEGFEETKEGAKKNQLEHRCHSFNSFQVRSPFQGNLPKRRVTL